jgi:hypothetical protein
MSDEELIARRALIKAAVGSVVLPVLGMAAGGLAMAAAPAPAAGPAAAGAALVPLKPDDPTAKALGYSEDSTKVDLKLNPAHKPDQSCSGCVQFKGKAGDARGGCNIFAGKSVNAHGWCKVWAKKP